jgi:DNA-binding NarL/FixJ family response regulator
MADTDHWEQLRPKVSDAQLAAVYAEIVRHGPISAAGLGRLPDLGLHADQVAQAIDALVTLRLVQPTPVGAQFAAVNPDDATETLVDQRESLLLAQEAELYRHRQEVVELRARIATLRPVYHQARAYRGDDEVIHVLDETRDVNAVLNRTISECRSEVMACQPGGSRPEAVLAEALPRDLSLLARGIRLRSLYQHTALFDGPTIAYAETAIAAGSQIRTSTEVPPRMIIVDRATAFLRHGTRDGGAVVIREPSTVAVLVAGFEQAWTAARPFRKGLLAARETLDETKMKILQLLAEGLTDKAVAARLGMAERTCREHVSALYKQLGVRSRFQAGVAARAQGLVGEP